MFSEYVTLDSIFEGHKKSMRAKVFYAPTLCGQEFHWFILYCFAYSKRKDCAAQVRAVAVLLIQTDPPVLPHTIYYYNNNI